MSSPTIIYLEAADDLSQVLLKLGRVKTTQAVLVIPRGAVLLHSPLNLKVLKRWLDRQERTVRLAIADTVGGLFAEQAGFELAPIPLTPEPTFTSADFESNAMPVVDELEIDNIIAQSPASIPFAQHGLRSSKPHTGLPTQVLFPTRWRPQISRSLKFGLLFAGIGLIILGSVGYFVIPRATVNLEVQSEPFKKQLALTLGDEQDIQAVGANVLTGRFLEVTRENVSSFPATGEHNTGDKASGQITVFNHTGSIVGLLANTRFQAPNGLIFRSKSELLVSPANGKTPGHAVVETIADEGGIKYNVASGLQLTIPGLASNAQALVYAEVTGNFAGGTDQITKVVSQDDIDKAKEEAAKNVFAAAETDLEKQLAHNEEIIPNFVQNDVVDAIPSVTAGTTQDQFEVRVQSRSWVLAIRKNQLHDAIFNAALFEVPEGKQLTKRTIDSAKIDVTQGNFLTHRINLAVSLDGRVGPRLDNNDIVSHLANQRLASAQTYLQGLSMVSSSNITIWPRLITHLPLLRNNIHVQVVYLGE